MSADPEAKSWWNRMFGPAEGLAGDEPPPEEQIERLRAELDAMAEKLAAALERASVDRNLAAARERENAAFDAALASANLRCEKLEAAAKDYQRGLDGAVQRERRSASELAKLRAVCRKAQNDARTYQARTAEALAHAAELEAENRELRDQLDLLRRSVASERERCVDQNTALASLQNRLEQATRVRDDARRQAQQARSRVHNIGTELAEAQASRGGLERREAGLRADLKLARAFVIAMIRAAAAAIRTCVGSNVALPLAVGWRKCPPSAALLGVGDEASLDAALEQQLERLGFCRGRISRSDGGVIIECTLVDALADPDLDTRRGFEMFLAQYFCAWWGAAEQRPRSLASLAATDPDSPTRFVVTLA